MNCTTEVVPDFLLELLPQHPDGARGMLAEAVRYSEEHREEWEQECERIDAQRKAILN